MILPESFYNRSALRVAQDLLGCFLVRRLNGKVIKAKIVETEAYNGPRDLASHASRGRTERNKPMFGPPGIFYVYFTYGMHYMLNMVTGREGYPAAVLIRAVELFQMRNSELGMRNDDGRIPQSAIRNPHLTDGPAKLTKFLKIDKAFNGLPCFIKKYGLWVEGRKENILARNIARSARIGVDYAGIYKDRKWRYFLRNNLYVSQK